MWRTKRFLLSLTGMLIVSSLQGQHRYNAWFRATLSYPLNDKLSLDTEVQHRRQNGFDNKDLLDKSLMYTARSWMHYKHHQELKFSVSPFAYFSNYRIIRNPLDETTAPGREIRVSAALEWQHKIFQKTYVIERTALEYRVFETPAFRVTRLRNRIGIRCDAVDKLRLTIYDELFLNVAGVSSQFFLDHNRIGINVEYQITPVFKVETGYVYSTRLPLMDTRMLDENNLFLNLVYKLRRLNRAPRT